MEKDRVFFKTIKSKNEDTIKVKEFIIDEILNNVDSYNKNMYLRIVIDTSKYPYAEVKKKWIFDTCKTYLGKCDIQMYNCLIHTNKCNLTINKIK